MKRAVSLSEAVYRFGAGIFFIGYFIFEVPSNLILHRVGARIWIARIMITWGIISGMTAYIGPIADVLGSAPRRSSTRCAFCWAPQRPDSSRESFFISTIDIYRIGRAAPWSFCSRRNRCRSSSAPPPAASWTLLLMCKEYWLAVDVSDRGGSRAPARDRRDLLPQERDR